VAADEVHSHKPLTQGYLGVLKDSTHLLTEVAVALGTAEPAILSLVTMMLTAIGADHIITPT